MGDRHLERALHALTVDHDRLRAEHTRLLAAKKSLTDRIAALAEALEAARRTRTESVQEEIRFRSAYADAAKRAELEQRRIEEEIRTLDEERIRPHEAKLRVVATRRRALERLLERRAEERRRAADKRDQAAMDEAALLRHETRRRGV